MTDKNLVYGSIFVIIVLISGLFVVAFNTNYFKGSQGIQGIQGIAGLNFNETLPYTLLFNGTNGTNGTNGINGTNGTNGTNGINGTNGMSLLGYRLVVGNLYRSLLMDTPFTLNGALGANTLYAVYFPVVQTATFDRIAVEFFSVVANNKIRLGIYNDNGAGVPSSLVLDAGELTLSIGAGVRTLTINHQLGVNGYWLAILCKENTDTVYYDVAKGLDMLGSASFTAGPNCEAYVTQAYGVLPNNFPNSPVFTGYMLAIGLRLASVP